MFWNIQVSHKWSFWECSVNFSISINLQSMFQDGVIFLDEIH